MDEEQTLININLAQVDVLAHLPGIGQQRAEKIVAYRETVHPFHEIMELTAVSGISERMVRVFADQITVGSFAEAKETADIAATADTAETAVSPDPLPPTIPEPMTDIAKEEVKEEVVEEAEERPLTNPPVAAPPTQQYMMPAASPPAISRRRGCLFAALAVVLGALIGVGATLGILAAINNGSLAFSRTDAQIRQELAGAQAAQGDLAAQVAQLNNAISAIATRTGELAQQQGTTTSQLATAQADITTATTALTTTQGEVGTLAETTEQLGQEIDTITIAAETFNTFLTRLRELLIGLETPLAETATPTTTTPVTTPVATPVTTPVATPVASPTQPPTRTPRPTATAFAPTATVVPTALPPTPSPSP
jgi:competence ComEA-like helix-hairpin-helix protein